MPLCTGIIQYVVKIAYPISRRYSEFSKTLDFFWRAS